MFEKIPKLPALLDQLTNCFEEKTVHQNYSHEMYDLYDILVFKETPKEIISNIYTDVHELGLN
jgi:hypothetical protein